MEYWPWVGDLGKCWIQIERASNVTHKSTQNRMVYIQDLGAYLKTASFSYAISQ
jgi:hypothetical protein